jgi:acyl dehydratase
MAKPKVGDSYQETRTISDQDVRDFARISGDSNPVHLDDAFAAGTRFKKRIAHGMLVASTISKVGGMNLPGPGSIYLSQSLKFKAPCYVGDEITTRVEVTSVREDKPLVTLTTTVLNAKGEVLIEGEAVLMYAV